MGKQKLLLFLIGFIIFGSVNMKAQRNDQYDNLNTIQKVFKVKKQDLQNHIFIVEDKMRNLFNFYDDLRNKKIPIYISADGMTHLYHILFDYALSQYEEKNIIPNLKKLLSLLIKDLQKKKFAGYSEKGKKLLLSYLKVSYTLLTNNPIGLNSVEKKEIGLINSHIGFAKSYLFNYKEDYSQYIPRGHYTKSVALKRYFKSMMYMGRLTFLANAIGMREETLNTQTAAALILTFELKNNSIFYEYWKEIFSPISFLVGFSDDLTVDNYGPFLSQIKNIKKINENELKNIRAEIEKLKPPKIYSGTGDIEVKNAGEGNKKLAKTQGLRFFGQRFVFDSYIFSKMVWPYVGMYKGKKSPITGRNKRVFPSPLDLINALNIDYAQVLLKQTDESNYQKYDIQMEKMQKYLKNYSAQDWNRTIYNKWIKTLSLLYKKQDNEQHKKRFIRTFLGSWAELRHDTILYVKQSYTMKATAFFPGHKEKNILLGYPEENKKFWQSFKELNEMTANFYKDNYLLYNKFLQLTNIADRMLSILEEKSLTDEDLKYFYKFPDNIEKLLDNVDWRSQSAIMVADVHTDANSGKVLEVGVFGFAHMLIVPHNYPNIIFVGPIFNYTHFISNKRLTDEEFEKQVYQNKIKVLDYLQ